MRKHFYLLVPLSSLILAISALLLMIFVSTITLSPLFYPLLILPFIPLIIFGSRENKIQKLLVVNSLFSLLLCLLATVMLSQTGTGFEDEGKVGFNLETLLFSLSFLFIPLFFWGGVAIIVGKVIRFFASGNFSLFIKEKISR